jgi:hypothetical protein
MKTKSNCNMGGAATLWDKMVWKLEVKIWPDGAGGTCIL